MVLFRCSLLHLTPQGIFSPETSAYVLCGLPNDPRAHTQGAEENFPGLEVAKSASIQQPTTDRISCLECLQP